MNQELTDKEKVNEDLTEYRREVEEIKAETLVAYKSRLIEEVENRIKDSEPVHPDAITLHVWKALNHELNWVRDIINKIEV